MADDRRWRVTGLLVPVGAITIWQLLGAAGLLRYEYFPSPGEVMAALGALLRDGELVGAVGHTLGVTTAAAAIALPVGGVLGLGLGLVPRWGRWVVATIDVARAVPAVALIPAAVLAVGPTASTEVLLATYAALWPVVMTTAGGVAAVHPRQYDVARMLHLSRGATVRKIVVPATLPAWLVGARLAMIIALLVAIVVEMLLYPRGLGGGLIGSFNALDPARMWAYALVCGIVGFGLSAALRWAAHRVVPAGPASVPAAVGQPGTELRGLLPLVALLAFCQVVAQPNSIVLPPPGEWLAALHRLSGDGLLYPAVGQTATTYVLGLALATLIGLAVGAAIGFSGRLDRALTPTIDFLASVPAAALLPVAILLLGPGRSAGVVVVGGIVAWPILLHVAAAARTIPVVRLEMSRTIGLTRRQRWVKVCLPSLLPGALLGLRVASALALIVTLLADIFGSGGGIGRLLVISQQNFDASAAWGLLLLVGIFGYLASVGFARTAHLFGARVHTSGQTAACRPGTRTPAATRVVSHGGQAQLGALD